MPLPGANDQPASCTAAPLWFFEIDGQRAGPYRWALIVELVKLHGLTAQDKLGSTHELELRSVSEFPGLVALLADPDAPQNLVSPAGTSMSAVHRALCLGFGALWIFASFSYLTLSALSWPGVIDGVLLTRIQAFGLILFALSGGTLLPALWCALRGRNTKAAGLMRVVAASCGFAIFLLLVTLTSNAPDIFLTAIGRDPMGRAEVHVTADGQLELKGPFAAGAAKQVATLLAVHRGVHTLHLNSPGGWVREGVTLANIVEQHGLATDSNTGCYSACVIAYLAGSPRTLHPEARLGFHSSSGTSTDSVYLREANQEVAGRLAKLGAPAKFIEKAVNTPATSLWTPDPAILLADHLIDAISRQGFADAGESLDLMAGAATLKESAYPFLKTFRHAEPAKFAAFDTSLRLALRRAAEDSELDAIIADLKQHVLKGS
jgi:hypothetical protein